MKRKALRLSGLLVVVCSIAISVLAIYSNLERDRSLAVGKRVVSNLHIGMQREDTQPYVQEAWRLYRCDYSTWTKDVYLFGNRDPNLASIVLLRFVKENGRETLDQISSYKSDMLHEFADCQLFEK
jgi:hypothetical protein